VVISSRFNLVKAPSPSCDEAATASVEWRRHHSSISLLDLLSSSSDIQQRRALENCVIWLDRVVGRGEFRIREIRDNMPHSD
jgi:hypothetical protein